MNRRRVMLMLPALIFLAGTCHARAEGFLRTRGQDIVDERDQKVILRGVGLGNWMLPEGYMWKFGNEADRPRKIEKLVSDLIGPEDAEHFWSEFRKNYITESDIRRIAELGFNSVRPALNARLFLTEGDNPVEVREGYELLDALVGSCKKYNVYVILDMHGAPGGQTGANIDDSANDQPELFMDPKYQERLIGLWVKIAGRYKDEPTVAAYDLLNEPLPGRTGAAAKYKDQLEPLYKRITEAIRAVDSRHMITLEGVDWANDWSVFTRPFDDQLIYQFHYYCWEPQETLQGIDKYLAYRDRLDKPVWVGETGEKDNTIYWGTTQYFESRNIGWSFWPWKKMDTANTPYSIKSPEGWSQVQAYSRGGSKPSSETAKKAFVELRENVRLEHCTYFPDVVNALFRRVPARVEAENYSHEGADRSYFVKTSDTKSKYYRTSEPVPVELIETQGRRSSPVVIKLGEGEWTAYTINSQEPRRYDAIVRLKAEALPASFQLSANGRTQEKTIEREGWVEINLEPVALEKGANTLRLQVQSGTVRFDWLDLK